MNSLTNNLLRLKRVGAAGRAGTKYAGCAEASVPCNKFVLYLCFLLCCFVNYGLTSLSPSVSCLLTVEFKVLDTGNRYSTAV